jgi:CHASE2 domain-containing sensor protein
MSDPRHPPQKPRVEQPRAEPEIIPPGARGGSGGVYEIRFQRPPLSILLVLVVAALVSIAVIVLVVGALIVWIPVVVFVLSLALIGVYARYYWLRFKSRLRR